MQLYDKANVLAGGSITLENAPIITVGSSGVVHFIVVIDNGAGGVPTGSPDITWGLYVASSKDTQFVRFQATNALLAAELANIEPNGDNAIVSAEASVSRISPGTQMKLVPVTVSGGGATSRLTAWAISN